MLSHIMRDLNCLAACANFAVLYFSNTIWNNFIYLQLTLKMELTWKLDRKLGMFHFAKRWTWKEVFRCVWVHHASDFLKYHSIEFTLKWYYLQIVHIRTNFLCLNLANSQFHKKFSIFWDGKNDDEIYFQWNTYES